jgi:hypothetical protein
MFLKILSTKFLLKRFHLSNTRYSIDRRSHMVSIELPFKKYLIIQLNSGREYYIGEEQFKAC